MIETARLFLRLWRDEDREPFWAMSQDGEVMRYLRAYSRDECFSANDRMNAMAAEHGHCFWAVERKSDARFIGFCGIVPPREPTWEYEMGWLLERTLWGQGFAREAAQACLDWAWDVLNTSTVVGITVPANDRSCELMRRLGMDRNPDEDFDSPGLPHDDPLRRCVVYRITRPQ